jgi:hypothetical protein
MPGRARPLFDLPRPHLDNWYFGHLHRRCKCQRLADLQDLSATSQEMASEWHLCAVRFTFRKLGEHTWSTQQSSPWCSPVTNSPISSGRFLKGGRGRCLRDNLQQLIDTCQDYLWSQQNIGFHEKPHQNVTLKHSSNVQFQAADGMPRRCGMRISRPPFFQTLKSKTVTWGTGKLAQIAHSENVLYEPTEKVISEVTGCPA